MPQKRKRALTVDEPRTRLRSLKLRQDSREDYKLGRIKDLPDEELSKDGLDRRREAHECKKTHPGRYCSECNPRAYQSEDDEGLSEEEADLSESWSNGSHSYSGDHSPTYSELWHTEYEERTATQHYKRQIAIVDDVATQLKTLADKQNSPTTPIGGLRGEWNLYNLDICPKTLEPDGEYIRLTISNHAIVGKLSSWDRMNIHPFMEWEVKDAVGEIAAHCFSTSYACINRAHSDPIERKDF